VITDADAIILDSQVHKSIQMASNVATTGRCFLDCLMTDFL
jgi:hypothetical protein